jgi:D-glycero-alpha-D-manno-heptose-7-phosphate kinase
MKRRTHTAGPVQAISRTPYRVSFAGGGTDIPAFSEHEPGAVLTTAIEAAIVVLVRRRDDSASGSGSLWGDSPDLAHAHGHDLIRESLRLTRTDEPLAIAIQGEVPAGTGMASSSSLTVGLLSAFHALRGERINRHRLAREACRIEVEILKKPIGYQDQFAAAFGGLNYIRFLPGGGVVVEPVSCRMEVSAELERRMLLFFTGQTRDADTILRRQSAGTGQCFGTLRRMRDIAGEMRLALSGPGDLDEFGRLLHEGWILKRSLGFGITCAKVDEWYTAARRAGAQGGKLLGAGGGGYLLIMAPAERHEEIRRVLGRPPELRFRMSPHGCRTIVAGDRTERPGRACFDRMPDALGIARSVGDVRTSLLSTGGLSKGGWHELVADSVHGPSTWIAH